MGGAGHRGQLDLDHWGNPAGIPVLAQPSYMTLGKSLTLSESQISSPKQEPPHLPPRAAVDLLWLLARSALKYSKMLKEVSRIIVILLPVLSPQLGSRLCWEGSIYVH